MSRSSRSGENFYAKGEIMLTIALDFLTALELDPLELLHQAESNACSSIGILVQPYAGLPFPDPHLLGNSQTLRELRRAVQDSPVGIDLVECFVMEETTRVADFHEALEIAAELGAQMVNTLALDEELPRLGDNYGDFCALAAEHGLTVVAEVHRMTALPSIAAAVNNFQNWGVDVKIEIDSLHFFRYGGEIAELRDYAAHIARAQISDGPPVVASDSDYMTEALYQRGIPGEGGLALTEFLAALPDGIVVGVEVPRTDLRTAERVRNAVNASRALARAAGVEMR
jgi:sugar phosphate isomerase/epimerase